MPKIASQAVKADVFAAVAAADGGRAVGFSRSDVVTQFSESGVSQATLFRWVKEAMGDPPVPSKPEKPPAEIEIIRPPRTPPCTPPANPIRQSAVPMSPQELVQDSHRRVNATIALAETEDGQIRNPRLLLAGLQERRKWVITDKEIRDTDALDAFLEALTMAVKEEGPAVWDRVSTRMRAINQAHGYFG